VVPTRSIELLKSEDTAKSQRVMQAIMQMKKIDIATLEKAAEGQ